MELQTEKGGISVSSAVFTNIAGVAASNCFGVKGMAVRSMTDGLVHLLRKEAMGKGVLVTFHGDNTISIDLHIIVDHGVNVPAVAKSIISEVSYVVEKTTATEVRKVNVFVDSMIVGG
ncbi:MAG: Asp23/Gls24 family envelope stress response protein [Oscillospiraceae bacterium]|nr:Asp23/Gls24 family envelope stress response protein [Oscillospiraceae bacterium]